MRLTFMILFILTTFNVHATHTPSKVQQYSLNNGLKILVKEDHRAPVVVSMIWYNVGSADEPGGITGVSHVVEHMMFKGTSRYPTGVFSKTIAALGGQENAMTNYDYTAYYEKIPAVQLPIAFELEADRMRNLQFNSHELTKEINVIREERRLRTDDNPQAITFEHYMATAYLTDPYHHPVIGWMGDLNEMTLGDVKAWYDNFYTPNHATLVVVGDVIGQNVVELANLYFGKIARQPSYQRKKQVEPTNFGEKRIDIHAPAKIPMLMIGYTVPSAKTAQRIWEPYALELAAGILDEGNSARFSKNLIRGSHIASHAETYYNLYSRYQSQFILWGTPAQNRSTEELKQHFLKEIKRLQTEPIEARELTRVKTQLIAQKTFEQDSIFGQAMEIGLLETLGLGQETGDKFIDHIQSVTAQQIQAVAKQYLNDSALTEARLYPSSQQGK